MGKKGIGITGDGKDHYKRNIFRIRVKKDRRMEDAGTAVGTNVSLTSLEWGYR